MIGRHFFSKTLPKAVKSTSTEDSKEGSMSFIYHKSNFQSGGSNQPSATTMLRLKITEAHIYDPMSESATVDIPNAGLGMGVALFDKNDKFCGWIRAFDAHIVFERLERGHKIMAQIDPDSITSFWWEDGGGLCQGGLVEFIDVGVAENVDENLVALY